MPKRGSAALGMGGGGKAVKGRARIGGVVSNMGALASACQHEAEMNEPRSMEDYLQAEIAHKEEADRALKAAAGPRGIGFGRRRSGEAGVITIRLLLLLVVLKLT